MIFPTDHIVALPSEPVDAERARRDGWEVLLEVAASARLLGVLRGRGPTGADGRKLLDRVVAETSDVVMALTGPLVGGAITLATWSRSMRAALVPRIFAGSLALLGDPEPAPADVEATADQARRQLGYLARFRDQVASAEQLLDGTAVNRAGLYASAIWGTATNVLRGRMVRDGYGTERRRLGVADHCGDCLVEASLGWQPAGVLRSIGRTKCQWRCRCWFEYRGGGGAGAPMAPEPDPVPAGPRPRRAGPEGLKFVGSEKARDAGDITLRADVRRLDEAFRRDRSYYIPPGGGGAEVPGRMHGFRSFLETARVAGLAIEQSRITVDADGTASFTDGRHRFAVLRDQGLAEVPVSVDRAHVARARKLFGVR